MLTILHERGITVSVKTKMLMSWTAAFFIFSILWESSSFFFILPYLVYYDAGLSFLFGFSASALTLLVLRSKYPYHIRFLDTVAVFTGTSGILYLYNNAAAAYTLRCQKYYQTGSIPEEFLMSYIYRDYFNLSKDFTVLFLVFFLILASVFILAFLWNIKSKEKVSRTELINFLTACYGWVHFFLVRAFNANYAWNKLNPLPAPLHFLLIFPTVLTPLLILSLGLTWYGIKPLMPKFNPNDLLNIKIK